MGLFFDRRPEGGGVGAFAPDRREALRRSPIDAIPTDLVLLGRVVGLLRGVCSSLGTPLTPMQMLRPFAEQVLGRPSSPRGGSRLTCDCIAQRAVNGRRRMRAHSESADREVNSHGR